MASRLSLSQCKGNGIRMVDVVLDKLKNEISKLVLNSNISPSLCITLTCDTRMTSSSKRVSKSLVVELGLIMHTLLNGQSLLLC